MREVMISLTHCGCVITATSGIPWRRRDYSAKPLENILKVFDLYFEKELYSQEMFSIHSDEQDDIDGLSIRISTSSENEERFFGELTTIGFHSSWNGCQPTNYEDINSFAINKYQFVRDWLMLIVEQFPEVPLTEDGKRFLDYVNFVEPIAEKCMPNKYHSGTTNYRRLMTENNFSDVWSEVPYKVILEPCAVIKIMKKGRPKTRLKNLIRKHVKLSRTEKEVFTSTIKYIIDSDIVDVEIKELLQVNLILCGLENENVVNQ